MKITKQIKASFSFNKINRPRIRSLLMSPFYFTFLRKCIVLGSFLLEGRIIG